MAIEKGATIVAPFYKYLMTKDEFRKSFYTEHDAWEQTFQAWREIYKFDVTPTDDMFRRALVARLDYVIKHKGNTSDLFELAISDLQSPNMALKHRIVFLNGHDNRSKVISKR
ncbi:MAG: hypothetical protein JSS79_05130 [Bacteroidetes bacterium]|nr:hypothetical protein [Bacteroidota bacterium]